MRGILLIMPLRSNRKVPLDPDHRRYKDCNRIGRLFDRIRPRRRIATLGHLMARARALHPGAAGRRLLLLPFRARITWGSIDRLPRDTSSGGHLKGSPVRSAK